MGADLRLGWSDVDRLAGEVAQQLLRSAFRPTVILAIARGGMVPAATLAHLLGIKRVELVRASSYGADRAQSRVRLGRIPILDHERVLVVDDLIDSGATMRHVRRYYPQSQGAALLSKLADAPVEFCGRRIEPDIWVVFPWEVRA